LTVVKNKVNRPNACFTALCQSTDFDDQSNLSPIVHIRKINETNYNNRNKLGTLPEDKWKRDW
jgi:hypothetical protein